MPKLSEHWLGMMSRVKLLFLALKLLFLALKLLFLALKLLFLALLHTIYLTCLPVDSQYLHFP